jgi:hypothetical protein
MQAATAAFSVGGSREALGDCQAALAALRAARPSCGTAAAKGALSLLRARGSLLPMAPPPPQELPRTASHAGAPAASRRCRYAAAARRSRASLPSLLSR